MQPSCYGNHSIIESCLKICRQYDMDARDIAEITIGTTPAFDENNGPFELGDSPQKALFSARYAAANVLVRKSARLEHYR
jgi:2-methylcitrate dehydratase PrpD